MQQRWKQLAQAGKELAGNVQQSVQQQLSTSRRTGEPSGPWRNRSEVCSQQYIYLVPEPAWLKHRVLCRCAGDRDGAHFGGSGPPSPAGASGGLAQTRPITRTTTPNLSGLSAEEAVHLLQSQNKALRERLQAAQGVAEDNAKLKAELLQYSQLLVGAGLARRQLLLAPAAAAEWMHKGVPAASPFCLQGWRKKWPCP